MSNTPDNILSLSLTNHGSIWLAHPHNDWARRELASRVSDEAQWFGRALVIEPRYVQDFVDAVTADGWYVE